VVRTAEALGTPEAHAAYAQFFRVLQHCLKLVRRQHNKIMEFYLSHPSSKVLKGHSMTRSVLGVGLVSQGATEECADLVNNVNAMVSRGAELLNSPQTTVAVAEFVANVTSALEEEHATYARERTDEFVPFDPDHDLKKEKGVDVGDDYDEDLVLGLSKAESQALQEEEDDSARRGKGPGPVGEDEGAGSGGEGPKLPAWDRQKWQDSLDRSAMRRSQRSMSRLFQDHVQQAAEKQAQVEKERKRADEQRALTCVVSFLFFLTWTTFALIGVRASVHHLRNLW
jgi:phosphate/sulfate permease